MILQCGTFERRLQLAKEFRLPQFISLSDLSTAAVKLPKRELRRQVDQFEPDFEKAPDLYYDRRRWSFHASQL